MRRGATRGRVEAVTGEEPEARSRHAGIFRSPYPGIEIPEAPLTPFVLERAGELGDKPALVDGPTGRTISYSAFAGAVRRAAAGLAGRGFEKGAVLAIYSPNLPEYAVAVHAVASLGGVVTPANPLNTAGELAPARRLGCEVATHGAAVTGSGARGGKPGWRARDLRLRRRAGSDAVR